MPVEQMRLRATSDSDFARTKALWLAGENWPAVPYKAKEAGRRVLPMSFNGIAGVSRAMPINRAGS